MTLATLCSTLELLKHRASQLSTRQAYSREDVEHYKVLTWHRHNRRPAPAVPIHGYTAIALISRL